MSKPNPFQKGNQSASNQTFNPNIGGASNTFQQNETIDRSYSRSHLRREEKLAKQAQYRHFIDVQQEQANFMAKTAGRKLGIDTKRPAHRLWMGLIVIAGVYTVGRWVYGKSRPNFWSVMNLPNQGYSISMVSQEELDILGTLPEPVTTTGVPNPIVEKELLAKQTAFNNLPPMEQHKYIPCYPFSHTFKQCMSYDQLHRKVDQCMFQLQEYNKCMLQHRLQPIINDVQNGSNNINGTSEIYLLPTQHNNYKY